jgi:hypothetical protein
MRLSEVPHGLYPHQQEVTMSRSRAMLKVTATAFMGLAGCVSATFVPTGTAYPAKASDCEIQVFSSTLPDRPYEEIGIVEGEGTEWKSDLEDVLPKLKSEACAGGGDGIILFSTDTFAQGEQGTRVQRVSATVIRWKVDS